MVIPNPSLSIYEDAITCWKGEKMSSWKNKLIQNAHHFDFPIHDPYFELNEKLKYIQDEIQCRVGVGGIGYGKAQNPSISDYADGVDTIQFLINNLN